MRAAAVASFAETRQASQSLAPCSPLLFVCSEACLCCWSRYFDEDMSGAMDATEFRQLYDNLLGQGYALGEFDATLAAVDKTREGAVSFNEYMAWMLGMGCLNWAQ